MASITPFLWLDNNVPEAVAFYESVFPNAKVETVNDFMATFELEGQKFNALNGGPRFKFNEAVSFFISVESQEELDYFWNKLTADGGEESKCGWLKDKFGLSWQVVPTALGKMMSGGNPKKSQSVMQALMQMTKLDIGKLKQAYEAAAHLCREPNAAIFSHWRSTLRGWQRGRSPAKERIMTAHGHFHWNELRTRNAVRAKKFYEETIGWTFEGSKTPDGTTYWIAMMGGQPVAGLFELTERFKDVPESWIPFLAVDDVDARVKKATAAGAKLVMPIFDVPNVGRIAMLLEPSGAGIGWMTPV